jgi:hypothetical protein
MGRRLRKLVDAGMQSGRNSTRCMARRRTASPRCTQFHTAANLCATFRSLFRFGCNVLSSAWDIEITAWFHHRCAKTHAKLSEGAIGVWHSHQHQHRHPCPFRFDFLLSYVSNFFFLFIILQQIPWASCWLQTDSHLLYIYPFYHC